MLLWFCFKFVLSFLYFLVLKEFLDSYCWYLLRKNLQTLSFWKITFCPNNYKSFTVIKRYESFLWHFVPMFEPLYKSFLSWTLRIWHYFPLNKGNIYPLKYVWTDFFTTRSYWSVLRDILSVFILFIKHWLKMIICA